MRLLRFVLAFALLPLGCASVGAPPPNASPAAVVAFRAEQVGTSLNALKAGVLTLNSSGKLSDEATLACIKAHRAAFIAGKELILSVQAGQSSPEGRAAFIAAIRKALTDLPTYLSPADRERVAPLLAGVLSALTLLEAL